MKSCAELAADKSGDALKDVQLMLWLTESMREEPFLINHLVRIACLQITAQTIWEGLVQHKWTDAQLQALQGRLVQLDFLSSIEYSMGAERAGGIATIEWVRKNGRFSFLLNERESGVTTGSGIDVITHLFPRGWFRMESASYGRVLDTNLAGVVDLNRHVVDYQKLAANNRELKETLRPGAQMLLEHRMFASMLLPAIKDISRKFAAAQNTADEAAAACALERHRLATGQLPETLAALAPKFIAKVPHDVLTGEPLKYEREGETDFVLSSVGWPETEVSSSNTKSKRTEWIWHSAP